MSAKMFGVCLCVRIQPSDRRRLQCGRAELTSPACARALFSFLCSIRHTHKDKHTNTRRFPSHPAACLSAKWVLTARLHPRPHNNLAYTHIHSSPSHAPVATHTNTHIQEAYVYLFSCGFRANGSQWEVIVMLMSTCELLRAVCGKCVRARSDHSAGVCVCVCCGEGVWRVIVKGTIAELVPVFNTRLTFTSWTSGTVGCCITAPNTFSHFWKFAELIPLYVVGT